MTVSIEKEIDKYVEEAEVLGQGGTGATDKIPPKIIDSSYEIPLATIQANKEKTAGKRKVGESEGGSITISKKSKVIYEDVTTGGI